MKRITSLLFLYLVFTGLTCCYTHPDWQQISVRQKNGAEFECVLLSQRESSIVISRKMGYEVAPALAEAIAIPFDSLTAIEYRKTEWYHDENGWLRMKILPYQDIWRSGQQDKTSIGSLAFYKDKEPPELQKIK